MTMQDLSEGLKLFNQGVQDYTINTAVTDATKQVQDLNASAMTENQKRAEQMQIANSLAAKMAGNGATGAQLQAVERFTPPALNGPEDYFKNYLNATSPESAQQNVLNAKAFQQFKEHPEQEKLIETGKLQTQLQELKGKQETAITQLKEAGETKRDKAKLGLEREKLDAQKDMLNTKIQGKLDEITEKMVNSPGKPVPTQIGTKLLDLQEHQSDAKEMIDTIKRRPELASALTGQSTTSMRRLLGDEEAGVMLQRLTTLRASIGKTLFGLRENQSQINSLQQIVPNLDMPASVFLKEMEHLDQKLGESRMRSLDVWGKSGYNTKAFADEGAPSSGVSQEDVINEMNKSRASGQMLTPDQAMNKMNAVGSQSNISGAAPQAPSLPYQQYITRSGKIPRK